MFRNEKAHDTMNKPTDPVSPGKINSIMEGTSIEGEVRSDSNIRIDGQVKGTIHVRGRLIIGTSGIVNGDVHCQSSDIEGTMDGKIKCQGLLSLKATAKLKGDIHTEKLSIEPGAVFSGNCNMGGDVSSRQSAPTHPGAAAKPAPTKDQPAGTGRPEPVKPRP